MAGQVDCNCRASKGGRSPDGASGVPQSERLLGALGTALHICADLEHWDGSEPAPPLCAAILRVSDTVLALRS